MKELFVFLIKLLKLSVLVNISTLTFFCLQSCLLSQDRPTQKEREKGHLDGKVVTEIINMK